VVVEVDESKFGKRKYHRGHKVEGVWVVGLVERRPERKIVFVPVEKRDTTTLINLINKYVRKGSVIYTDKWKGYSRLNDHGYQHFTVNHSKEFVVLNTYIHTNSIEGSWSWLKACIPKRYRTKRLIKLYLLILMAKRNVYENLFSYLIKLL
jgi:transposase-like protein